MKVAKKKIAFRRRATFAEAFASAFVIALICAVAGERPSGKRVKAIHVKARKAREARRKAREAREAHKARGEHRAN